MFSDFQAASSPSIKGRSGTCHSFPVIVIKIKIKHGKTETIDVGISARRLNKIGKIYIHCIMHSSKTFIEESG